MGFKLDNLEDWQHYYSGYEEVFPIGSCYWHSIWYAICCMCTTTHTNSQLKTCIFWDNGLVVNILDK